LPGHVGSDLNFHVVEVAEEAGFVEGYGAEVVGGVAELEVYCGGKAVLTAVVADGGGFFEGLAHGFLNKGRSAVGEMGQDGHDLRGWDGDVEDGVGWCEGDGSLDGVEGAGDVAFFGQVGGFARCGVCDCDDGEAGFAVGGEVSVANDASGAEDDDWAGGFGEGWGGCFDGLPVAFFVTLHQFLVACAWGVSLYN